MEGTGGRVEMVWRYEIERKWGSCGDRGDGQTSYYYIGDGPHEHKLPALYRTESMSCFLDTLVVCV
jgi:hypothetical protein